MKEFGPRGDTFSGAPLGSATAFGFVRKAGFKKDLYFGMVLGDGQCTLVVM